MKILILEDDILLKELLIEHLEEKYIVVAFEDGEEALEYLYENRVDLALLDINVPGLKGDELLLQLRRLQNTTPVIFITSKNSAKDVKTGFELGCDDYLKKPFEFDELDARIEHIKRIYNIDATITIGEYRFDPKRHLLIKNGSSITLAPKVSKVLEYLYANKNRVVTKEELIENIWSFEEIPTDATIRSYIKTLRKYFPMIETVRGTGYEFKTV